MIGSLPWISGGDFIAIINRDDRLGGSTKRMAWQAELGFEVMLKQNWDVNGDVEANLHNFRVVVTHWNLESFGSIGRKKRRLLARIQGVEKNIELCGRDNLFNLENKLKAELETVLAQEETLWFQRSRH
ncbi:hypothetical protein V6N11_063554 [Hibiscus sabdariffa]|uniref:Uncharacterized protein n=2 Tax=Hibiscus sabdariffa TaxID=183260 RepID=A0ABR1ZYX6_9ROSI